MDTFPSIRTSMIPKNMQELNLKLFNENFHIMKILIKEVHKNIPSDIQFNFK